jgi:hypothetical protein
MRKFVTGAICVSSIALVMAVFGVRLKETATAIAASHAASKSRRYRSTWPG